MKKILFIAIATIGIIFNACNPMEDIMDDIDSNQAKEDAKALFLKDRQAAPADYTLTDEDYELSSNESVSNYKNFSNSALPKDHLPEILNKKFSGENAQSMMVTYDFYNPASPDKDNAREIEDEEYGEMGQRYSNFEDEDEAEALIAKLLDRKVYETDEGVELTVQYTKFERYVDRFIKINADGTAEEVGYTSDAVEVTDAIYEATGNGKYKNFYRMDNALDDLAKYVSDNGIAAPIVYSALVYQNYLDEYAVFMFNGTNWVVRQSVMPVSEELNYALDEDDITKSYWWADPAIKITLTTADYDLNEATSRYDNFDLRGGSIPPGTDRAKLAEMIGEMLDANHDAVENQQYLVTFAYYDGSSGVAQIRVIKEGGVWKEYEG